MTVPHDHCLNCGTALTGQYCGQCGQRATNRLISLWELVRDAFGDLFELDSRLWRTLLPLLGRPGRLTRDYLEGRRARYMPPFRMYLVLSVLFFVVAFTNWRAQFDLLLAPDEPAHGAATTQVTDTAEVAELDAEKRAKLRKALDELVAEGVLDESMVGPDGLITVPPAADDGGQGSTGKPAAPSPPRPEGVTTDDEDGLVIGLGEAGMINCDTDVYDVSSLPDWLQRRLTTARLRHLCERFKAVGQEGFLNALLDKVPAALIFLLPLMALVQKLLYPLSRRYYVEHLLFFVHFHSFVFLLLTLQILWSRLIGALGLNDAIAVLPVVASSLYVPVYLFVSLRRVYGQGRILTFLKFCALLVAYVLGSALIFLVALLVAALSI